MKESIESKFGGAPGMTPLGRFKDTKLEEWYSKVGFICILLCIISLVLYFSLSNGNGKFDIQDNLTLTSCIVFGVLGVFYLSVGEGK